jgi:hypothetical protein
MLWDNLPVRDVPDHTGIDFGMETGIPVSIVQEMQRIVCACSTLTYGTNPDFLQLVTGKFGVGFIRGHSFIRKNTARREVKRAFGF